MSEALQLGGGVVAASAGALVVLSGDRRLRAAAMAAALLVAVALIAGQAWNGQLASLRDSPAKLAALALAAAAGIGLLAAALDRRPGLLALGLVAMLPVRIPIDAGGETSNLLLPLYAVIAAGALLECRRAFDSAAPDEVAPAALPGPVRWLGYALAAGIVLYALQSAYSSDVERATQNIAFFFAPFALMFAMLREADWNPGLLRGALWIVVAEGLLFAVIGILQHETHHIFWNEKVMESNEFALNFRVNSLFWDPNIYGRYLALSVLVATSALVWIMSPRRFAAGAAAVAVILVGLVLAFSQTSVVALLAGLAVLAALRWSLRWTVVLCGAGVLAGALFIVFFSSSTVEVGGDSENALDQSTSGRTRLARGGLDLAKERPLAGFGSGSFAVEFEQRNPVAEREAAVSHTEPITIVAEQGAIGILAYLALLATSLALLLTGLRRIAPGLGGSFENDAAAVSRIAIAVAFAGLLVHSIGYAGFLTDPLTWTLLAIGAALIARAPTR